MFEIKQENNIRREGGRLEARIRVTQTTCIKTIVLTSRTHKETPETQASPDISRHSSRSQVLWSIDSDDSFCPVGDRVRDDLSLDVVHESKRRVRQ